MLRFCSPSQCVIFGNYRSRENYRHPRREWIPDVQTTYFAVGRKETSSTFTTQLSSLWLSGPTSIWTVTQLVGPSRSFSETVCATNRWCYFHGGGATTRAIGAPAKKLIATTLVARSDVS